MRILSISVVRVGRVNDAEENPELCWLRVVVGISGLLAEDAIHWSPNCESVSLSTEGYLALEITESSGVSESESELEPWVAGTF